MLLFSFDVATIIIRFMNILEILDMYVLFI